MLNGSFLIRRIRAPDPEPSYEPRRLYYWYLSEADVRNNFLTTSARPSPTMSLRFMLGSNVTFNLRSPVVGLCVGISLPKGVYT